VNGYLSQSVARLVTAGLLVLVAACSSGSGESGQRPKPTESPTTAPPATIDLSKPIPGGSLHGTPRPPLENTGDDYVAIFESLVGNLRWVSENPDVAVIPELFVPGTPGYDARVPAYTNLMDRGYRYADEGYHLISVDLASSQPEVVSLRVVHQLDFERVVDGNGEQIGEIRRHGPPEETVALLSISDGRWRIASWTSTNQTVEV
jgi:hypothetical protein